MGFGNIEGLPDNKRALFERELRDQLRKKIETFLQSSGPSGKQELPGELLLGVKPWMKRELYNQKLIGKLDQVSNPIISSYTWEMNRKQPLPSDPVDY